MTEILLSEDIKNHSVASSHYLRELLDGLPVGTYHVYVTKERLRTLNQNDYYWGIVLEYIAEFTGHTPLEIHNRLKVLFNPRTKASPTGNVLVFGGSTRKKNTVRFHRYIEEIRLWALYYLGVTIPDPKKLTEAQILSVESRKL